MGCRGTSGAPTGRLLLLAVWLSLCLGPSLSTRTIMAINAGGDTVVAADGEVFERDRYYQGGVVSKKGKELTINGTNSPALYQTERFAIGEELWYSLPIPFNVGHNGRGWTFVLTLKFVEVQFNATGRRMFGVNLNGLHVLRDIDVFSMVGWATAYDEQIEFRIDPDHYAIWVTSVGPMRVRIEQPAAFYGDLHVALTPTEFGNARLCAMQLTQGTLEELDAAAEAADPARRRLAAKKKKKADADKQWWRSSPKILLLFAGFAAALFGARELFAFNSKKRGLPAKLRERGKGREKETPPRSSPKKTEKETETETEKATEDTNESSKERGAERGKASPEPDKNPKSEPKPPRAESPRTQAKREERSRLKKEQREKQREKSRQESMRAEAEALAKAKAAAQSAARRSAAAFAALEEATAAEAAAEAQKAEEAQREAEREREAAKEAELAARAEAKQAKLKLKKKARKVVAKLSKTQTNSSGKQQPIQREHRENTEMDTDDTFEMFEPYSLGVDWSHTETEKDSILKVRRPPPAPAPPLLLSLVFGVSLTRVCVCARFQRLSSGSNSSFGTDEGSTVCFTPLCSASGFSNSLAGTRSLRTPALPRSPSPPPSFWLSVHLSCSF